MIRFQRAYLPVLAAPLAIGLLAIATMFGGASRLDILPPLAVRIAGIAVIAWIIWTAAPSTLARERTVPLIWAAMFAVPLAQLVPLPWTVWTTLPGHQLARDVNMALGLAPWHAISLTPDRTFNGLLALIPAFAAWLIARRLDENGRKAMLSAIALLTLASAVVGLMQRAAGSTSNLYFYAVTNETSSVGFFSNANHHAVFLCCGLIAVLGWLAQQVRRKKRGAPLDGMLALGAMAVIGASIIATESRAGVMLAPLALLFGMTLLPFHMLGIGPRTVRIGSLLVVGTGALAATLLIGGFLGDFGVSNGISDDSRLANLPIFVRIATDNLPFGAGMGSFDPVFRGYEETKTLNFSYLNNAHNDYAQIAIEAGLAGIGLVLIFLIWFFRRLFRQVVRGLPRSGSERMQWAGAGMVLLMLIHSVVDYPLRTAALSVLFGICCAFLSPPLVPSGEQG